MDSFLLARLARELSEDWTGAWAQQAWQDGAGRLILQLRRSGAAARTCFLLLSAVPEAQGVGLLDARPPCAPRPPLLAAYLRAHVCGGRLAFARCLPFERVVEVGIEGRRGCYQVILEATGRRGNVLVVDPDSAVRAAQHWEAAESHPLRPLEPGSPYAPPPRPPALRSPDQVSREEWDGWRARGEALHRLLAGIGPELGRALATWDWETFQKLVSSWGERRPVWEDDRGLHVVAGREAGSPMGRRDDALEAAGRWLESALAAKRSQTEASEREVAEHSRRKRLTDRLAKIRGDLERIPDANELRRTGDVLAAGLSTVRKGDTQARLTDPRDEGRSWVIPLDPASSPGQNLNRVYERAKKAERGRRALERRIEETLAELASAAPPSSPNRAGESSPGVPFRRFRASNGWPIWVGRNSKENDRLVKVARPWDLWLHARDVSGAHVLVRLPGRDAKVPEAVILEAAQLAALHSRAATDSAVDVAVVEADRLRKPKGASPGKVLVAGERTVRVRPGPAKT